MYNKIFTHILDSSVWLESQTTRLVWIMFIAVMDEDGFAMFASAENVARRANVSLAQAKHALDVLEAPDPHSSDPDNDGRRIERVDGGWVVLNAVKYRKMVSRAVAREQTRERVRKHREVGGGDPNGWTAIRARVLRRDRSVCAYCGGKATDVDHVTPKSKGGQTVESNLVASCRPCNSKKSNRTPESAEMPIISHHVTHRVTPSEAYTETGSETVGERARANAPPPVRHYGRTGSGPLAGSLPRDHLRHAFCGRVCLPEQLFGDFCRLIGGDPQTAPDRVRAFCASVDDAWSNGGQHSQEAIGDDVFSFWRARWAEQHGTTRKSAADIKREAEERIWAQS